MRSGVSALHAVAGGSLAVECGCERACAVSFVHGIDYHQDISNGDMLQGCGVEEVLARVASERCLRRNSCMGGALMFDDKLGCRT